ncbi:MAG: hypothetical protein HOE90_22795 [Bacteriovoracaceae bacterium]|nr:hypothetical protein [Bacteriovoracaceae bacterium]
MVILRNIFITFLIVPSAFAILCKNYQRDMDYSANIDSNIVFESSGISSSYDFPSKRQYHINDSGSGATFHVFFNSGIEFIGDRQIGKANDENGIRLPESVQIERGSAEDVEAINVGPCLPKEISVDEKPEGCIFLGDIGNNTLNRANLKIFIVAEKKEYKNLVKDKLTINFSYGPDDKDEVDHNAEAMMVHPVTGDIYLITKRTNPDPDKAVDGDINPRIYRLKRKHYEQSSGEVDVVFKHVRTIKIKAVFKEITKTKKSKKSKKSKKIRKQLKKYLVTDADFSPDGEKFAVIGLGGIVEFDSKVLDKKMKISSDLFNYIPSTVAPVLEQQEAITYSSDGGSLFYTSEKKHGPDKTAADGDPVEVIKLDCK